MRTFSVRSALAASSLALLVLLGGCAGTRQVAQATEGEEFYDANDPLEDVNRAIFDFNLFVDDYLLVPVAKTYRTVLPEPAQNGVRNFLDNLRSPVTLINDILQGEMSRAGDTFGRFLVNTTVGVGGLFDVAGDLGVPKHFEDFGQTFAVWGIGEGPYLMLPLLGPSTVRDATGTAVGYFADPLNLYLISEDLGYVTYIRAVLDAVDARSRNIELLQSVRETSLDYYATVRSFYRQRRAADIRNEGSPVPNVNPISSSSLPTGPAPAAPAAE